jgi:ArsR family transcriptional regulator, lead/cadmium/zinc/bismuth-responsive transcriptional repressor
MNRSTVVASDDLDVERHPHGARTAPNVSNGALEAAAGFFRAAGDVSRLRLLICLEQGEWCVSELAETLGEGLSTISQRLKVLRTEGLVSRRRDGKHLLYSLADAHVSGLVRAAIDHAEEQLPGRRAAR